MRPDKPKGDPRGGHVRLYWDLIDSMAWRALGWADQGLYIAMRRKLTQLNNGNIEATLATLKHSGITAPSSLAKGLRALVAVGLIERTRTGELSQGRRTCNLFRFTDEPNFEFPKQGVKASKATHEWRNFKTLAEAQTAIRAAHRAALTGGKRQRKNASSVQPLKAISSANELKTRFSSSTIEVGGRSPVQPLKLAGADQTAANPRQH